MTGAVIKCASSLTILDLAAMDIPEQCAAAFLGDHPMGQAFRDMLLRPGETSKCFLQLSHDVPTCSVDLWPFPLDGKSIQKGACVSSKIDAMINDQCIDGLSALDACLPSSKNDITLASCESYKDMCSGTESMYTNVLMMMPPHLLGMPLPETCTSAAMDNGLGSVVERYETYRIVCAETGSKVWENLEAGQGPKLQTISDFMHPSGGNSAPSTDNKSEKNEEPADQVLEEKNEPAEQKPLTNAQQNFDSNESSSSGAGSFGFGMLSGVALIGLVYAAVVIDRKRKSSGGSVMTAVGSLELGDFSGSKYSDVPASEMT